MSNVSFGRFLLPLPMVPPAASDPDLAFQDSAPRMQPMSSRLPSSTESTSRQDSLSLSFCAVADAWLRRRWAGVSLADRTCSMIWPGSGATQALLSSMHSRTNAVANWWRISRIKFFLFVGGAAFVWYWFLDSSSRTVLNACPSPDKTNSSRV